MLNESKILELVKRQKETGLTVTAFCSNEGIHKSTFYNWRNKLNKEPGKRFIPLLVNSRPAAMTVPAKDYNQGQIESHNSGDDFLLELIYPNGTRLRIKRDPDLDHIRSLVCLLG
jgi:Transposase